MGILLLKATCGIFFFQIGRTSLCFRDVSAILLGRTPSSVRLVISSHANCTDPLILWLQEGYQTGLALWEPQVQVQATPVLNLISPAAGVLRCRARSPTEVSEQPRWVWRGKWWARVNKLSWPWTNSLWRTGKFLQWPPYLYRLGSGLLQLTE